MDPFLISPNGYMVVIWVCALLVYYLLVRFNWAFLAPEDRYINSPVQLFVMRWFGNLLPAAGLGYVLSILVITFAPQLSFGLIQIDREAFDKIEVEEEARLFEEKRNHIQELFNSANFNTRMALLSELKKEGYLGGTLNPEWSNHLNVTFIIARQAIDSCRIHDGRQKLNAITNQGARELFEAIFLGELPYASKPCNAPPVR